MILTAFFIALCSLCDAKGRLGEQPCCLAAEVDGVPYTLQNTTDSFVGSCPSSCVYKQKGSRAPNPDLRCVDTVNDDSMCLAPPPPPSKIQARGSREPADSCQGKCGFKNEGHNCWCDEACPNYNDCCSNYIRICPQTVMTSGYSYKYFPLNEPVFRFEVKTKTDAHIALDFDENDSDLYEIVIGGWKNKLSMVRRGKQGPNISRGTVDMGSSAGQKGWTETPGIVSPTEFRSFWISAVKVNNKLVIKVGKDWESLPFMTGIDENPLKIRFVALSSFNSIQATWSF